MSTSAAQKIVKGAMLLMALQIFEQITGLVRQAMIAALFGTSEALDAYVVAGTIIGLLITWVSLPINQTLIPMFRHCLAREGERAAWANTSILFNNLAVILAVISLAVGLLAPGLIGIFAPGFSDTGEATAASLVRIMTVSVFFGGAAAVLTQIFLSYERFFRPGVSGSVNNLVAVVAMVVLVPMQGIHGLALAVVIGAMAEFAIQLPILWEKRQYYTPKVDLRHPEMLELGRLSTPLLLSAGGNDVARVTDRMFASMLPTGSVSALNFAQRLTGLQYDFLVRPLQYSSYPHFAKLTAERDFEALSRQLFSYLRVVLFISLPVAVGVMALSEPIVRLLFARGAFNETSVRLTSTALLVFSMGVPATGMNRILDRTFFTLKDTRTPTRLSLLRIAVKIGLAFLLMRPLAHLGIALAESLSQILRLPLLFRALPADIRRQEMGKTLASFGRTALIALVMGGAVYLLDTRISGWLPLPVELATLAAAGAGIFCVMAFVLSGDEARTVLGTVMALVRRSTRRG
jgi:putative peptidoglycan lipid II flippase